MKVWVAGAFVVFLLLFFIKVFDIAYPVAVSTSMRSSEFSVIGEGKVDVRPDVATVSVGVTVNNAATVEEAQRQMNEVNNKIVAAMNTLKIPKSDIRTSDYSIYPNYGVSGQQITGYNGNVSVQITVHDPAMVSQVIEQATVAGANQINSTQFTVEHPEKYREMAREKAIANAKEQAQKLSKDLGIKLGRIVNLVESSDYGAGPQPYYAADMARGMGGGGGPAVEPGSQTITSVVTLYYEKR